MSMGFIYMTMRNLLDFFKYICRNNKAVSAKLLVLISDVSDHLAKLINTIASSIVFMLSVTNIPSLLDISCVAS